MNDTADGFGKAFGVIGSKEREQPLLTVRNLGKRYGAGCMKCEEAAPASGNRCLHCGAVWGCSGITFDLHAGEILGVVGESGSGKSTVMRCLNFDEAATCGQMTLHAYQNGHVNLLEQSSQQKRYIRNHLMGMVYQNPHLGLRLDFSSSGNIAEKLSRRICAM